MIVRFIAHAGLSIREDNTHILIDPWFTPSNMEMPVMEALSGYSTIDFQTPHGDVHPEEYVPADAILLSHFHAHHAPKKDILDVVTKSAPRSITLGHPFIGIEKEEAVQALVTSGNEKAKAGTFDDGETMSIGPFTIRALTHTVPRHLAWHISSKSGSLLHLADPIAGYGADTRDHFDPAWDKFDKLSVDLLFLNASGNSFRNIEGERKFISERRCFTPGEAAMFVGRIAPKVTSLIGCYNKSIWNGRNEYVRPSYMIEDEFYWAMQWVAPDVKCIFARPGHTYAIGEEDAIADTSL